LSEAEASPPDLSVVIPARDEAGSLEALVTEIAAALKGRRYEIIVADDGSIDGTPALLTRLAASFPVRSVRHERPLGKSAGLFSAVLAARAPIVVALDGDGQNDPKYLPAMIEPFADPAIGLVSGQRLRRRDTLRKRVGSRIANWVRRGLLKDETRDTGCGLKAFRREAYLTLPFFETNHRFLPALFLGDGWAVTGVDVVDRPRLHGRSHYGVLDRLVVGIPDLFGVWWLLRRRRKNPRRREGTERTQDER
jgi:glycosyltransferase involved in cell wall biosynthesis